jgi:ribonucleoside-diphosphate reductase beta chain
MSILEPRSFYKPFSYPWAYEAYKAQSQMHWVPEEVPLKEDVNDWVLHLTQSEKNLLTQLFRFFTQADIDIAAGYYDKFLPLFPAPELRMMMGTFAAMEAIHIDAYSLLLETVGMPEVEYKAFQDYEDMAAKHEYLDSIQVEQWPSIGPRDISGYAKALAIYSAFGEGLQLFSSFAILLNFPRFGKMKGMGRIVTWSIRDETLHVQSMIQLFHTLRIENPEIWTDEFKGTLYQACRDMVELEDKFIDLAFEMGDMEGLTADQTKTYIRYIADRRLLQLGLKPHYGVKDSPLPWLDDMLALSEEVNFFENRVTEYNKGVIVGEIAW